MRNWSRALMVFCDIYFSSNKKIDWILVGSVGSVLQGADMLPNDIDIYTKSFEGVVEISKLLDDHHEINDSSLPCHDPGWLSSVNKPYFTQQFKSGFTWTKGKWMINSFDIEVVQISNSAGIPDSEDGQGIWEGGKYIWDHKKHIEFEGYIIPVIPLEIQLESNIRRGRMDRVDSIVNALKRYGYDRELLCKAVSTKNREMIKDLI